MRRAALAAEGTDTRTGIELFGHGGTRHLELAVHLGLDDGQTVDYDADEPPSIELARDQVVALRDALNDWLRLGEL